MSPMMMCLLILVATAGIAHVVGGGPRSTASNISEISVYGYRLLLTVRLLQLDTTDENFSKTLDQLQNDIQDFEPYLTKTDSPEILTVSRNIRSAKKLLKNRGRQIWDVQGSSLNFTVDKCGVECPSSQKSFYIWTGEKYDIGPTVCFDGEIIISQKLGNFGRGLNVVVINGKAKKAEVKYFDTYVEDADLIRFLMNDVPVDAFILVVSFDEASFGLTEHGRQLLKMYGSSLIDCLGFRENFIMIGQKGLREGGAIEYIGKKKASEKREQFAVPSEKAGCFSLSYLDPTILQPKLKSLETSLTALLQDKHKQRIAETSS